MGHLSTRQYARLVDEWVATIGLDCREYGTHSMRRTKASLIYKATGNLRAVQILLGHTNIENTVRYLGVDVDDALTLSERIDMSRMPAFGHVGGRQFALGVESCLSGIDPFLAIKDGEQERRLRPAMAAVRDEGKRAAIRRSTDCVADAAGPEILP